jgi:AcrR family transcriptional regulator
VGSETSVTRDLLLDAVEELMLDDGYAAVTYRAVAAKGGVTAGLVQYYFPSLDDVFIAAIRRRTAQNLERLHDLLQADPERPLHVLWEYSSEESTAALTTEFLALCNHHKNIGSEIASFTDEVRSLQLDTLATASVGRGAGLGELPVEVLLFVLTGIPKLLRLEESVGVSSTHSEVIRAFEHYLDEVEPTGGPERRTPTTGDAVGRTTADRV